MAEILTVVVDQPRTVTNLTRQNVATVTRQGVNSTTLVRESVNQVNQTTLATTLQTAQTTTVGLPGIQGPPGADVPLTLVAAQDLNYPRIVAAHAGMAYYPDLTNSDDVQRVVGVTLSAAAAGAFVPVARSSVFTETAWNWAPGPVFCALSDGLLTQTAPATGAVIEVGKATDPHTLVILIHRAILR